MGRYYSDLTTKIKDCSDASLFVHLPDIDADPVYAETLPQILDIIERYQTGNFDRRIAEADILRLCSLGLRLAPKVGSFKGGAKQNSNIRHALRSRCALSAREQNTEDRRANPSVPKLTANDVENIANVATMEVLLDIRKFEALAEVMYLFFDRINQFAILLNSIAKRDYELEHGYASKAEAIDPTSEDTNSDDRNKGVSVESLPDVL